MAFPHDGKKFQKGESGNPNGRPPKLKTLLNRSGFRFTANELHEVLSEMLLMDPDELETISQKGSKYTLLEQLVARSLLKAAYRGDPANLMQFMQRTLGAQPSPPYEPPEAATKATDERAEIELPGGMRVQL